METTVRVRLCTCKRMHACMCAVLGTRARGRGGAERTGSCHGVHDKGPYRHHSRLATRCKKPFVKCGPCHGWHKRKPAPADDDDDRTQRCKRQQGQVVEAVCGEPALLHVGRRVG